MLKLLTASLLALLLPVVAQAAGSATFDTGGDSQLVIYWQDDGNLRMGAANAGHYMLIENGKAYSVSTASKPAQVIELGGMIKALSGKNDQPTFGAIASIKATGKHETIAGIRGKVYRVDVVQPDGQQVSQTIVLTDNPLVREMTHAYISSFAAFAGNTRSDKFLAALPKGERGLLRTDDNFRLASITAKAPAADLFTLPAKPKKMADMMQGLQQKMRQMHQRMQQPQ